MIWWLMALSCATECPDGYGLDNQGECVALALGDEAPELDALDAPRLLRRMSLDLRGRLPSIEELDAVEADPDALAALRDQMLSESALEDRLVAMFAEIWQTRVDDFLGEYYDYHLDPDREFEFERAVGEEPLRLMARIAVEGRPWGEIVTADYTLADATLGEVWPLSFTGDASSGPGDWREAVYTDGRPGAGVLSTNGLWWRYYTTVSNANRARAAALSRLLICEDFLSRPVSFSEAPSVLDDEATAEAIRTDPNCLACHAALEPIAATLFGFWWDPPESALEISSYHPEREPLGESTLEVEMGFFGQPVNGLEGLGEAIEVDSRFAWCAAETAAAMLWRRPVASDDFDRVSALRDTFVAEGTFLPVLRAVTDTEVYRAADTDDEGDPTSRLLAPDLLASTIEDLTGFQWTWSGFEQLHNDTWGYRVLAGGLDGAEVLRLQQDPGLTWALVIERLAQAAASEVVDRDLSGEEEPLLLLYVDRDSVSSDEAFVQQIEALHWRFYGERPDAAWTESISALWEEIAASHSSEVAWRTLISAMLRDPLFVSY